MYCSAPAKYLRIIADNVEDFPQTRNIEITIRSVNDPVVVFYSLLGAGATTFGLSKV